MYLGMFLMCDVNGMVCMSVCIVV